MTQLKETTVKRYMDTYIVLRVNKISLSEVKNYSKQEFKEKTGRGVGDFKLARSLAKNNYVQESINKYIETKDIESTIIKPIKVENYFKIAPAKVKIKVPKDKKFMKMVRDFQKRTGTTRKQSILTMRYLLKVPKRDYHKLDLYEREILIDYGY